MFTFNTDMFYSYVMIITDFALFQVNEASTVNVFTTFATVIFKNTIFTPVDICKMS